MDFLVSYKAAPRHVCDQNRRSHAEVKGMVLAGNRKT